MSNKDAIFQFTSSTYYVTKGSQKSPIVSHGQVFFLPRQHFKLVSHRILLCYSHLTCSYNTIINSYKLKNQLIFFYMDIVDICIMYKKNGKN